jgi:hypothetical protein
MSATGRRRIDKIAGSLTPRQAVLLWLEEAAQSASLREYVLAIKDGPDSAFPMFRLPDQVGIGLALSTSVATALCCPTPTTTSGCWLLNSKG